MRLPDYDVNYMGRKAQEMGFIRDSLEKVMRLADILEYCNTNPVLKGSLALKGGTAINLTVFNLPRLSVDIDMDYTKNDSLEEMLLNRERFNDIIEKYMAFHGYILSPKARSQHSLDSWIYKYDNAGGNSDNIKLEVNYSLRSHILPLREHPIIAKHFLADYKLRTLALIEIYASKIIALLSRAASRDLFDVRNMIHFGIIKESEKTLLRKCIVFYAAVSARNINKTFDTKAIDGITRQKIKTELQPVIRKQEDFDLDAAKKIVKEYISELMNTSNDEKEFLDRFENKIYSPGLLFEDVKIIERIGQHPMALWKTR